MSSIESRKDGFDIALQQMKCVYHVVNGRRYCVYILMISILKYELCVNINAIRRVYCSVISRINFQVFKIVNYGFNCVNGLAFVVDSRKVYTLFYHR